MLCYREQSVENKQPPVFPRTAKVLQPPTKVHNKRRRRPSLIPAIHTAISHLSSPVLTIFSSYHFAFSYRCVVASLQQQQQQPNSIQKYWTSFSEN